MARCPACKTKQPYWRLVLLSLYGRQKFACKNCKSILQINQKKMIPFNLFFYTVAGLFGATMVHTGLYLRWLSVLLVWVLLVMVIYPFFVRFRVSGEK